LRGCPHFILIGEAPLLDRVVMDFLSEVDVGEFNADPKNSVKKPRTFN